jgi:nitrate/nitrite transporter NarK
MMNTFGNLGGFVSPIIFGYIVQSTGSWSMPFIIASIVSVCGAFLWLVIDPSKTIYQDVNS